MRAILLVGWILIAVAGAAEALPVLVIDGLPPRPIRATVSAGDWEGSDTFALHLVTQEGTLNLLVSGPGPSDLDLESIRTVDAQAVARPDGIRRMLRFLDERGAVVGVIGVKQQQGAMLLDMYTILPGTPLGPALEPRRDDVQVILRKGDFQGEVAPGGSRKIEIAGRPWVFTCYAATARAAARQPAGSIPGPSTGALLPAGPRIADESPPFAVDYTLFPAR